jgi:cbb3-type cytochrome oxidase subunit 1
MPRVDISFLILSAACLVVGVCLGIYMGIKHDFQLAPVHAHLNLLGWSSLALFGVTYRSYPELAQSRTALIHFWLSAPSAVIFPFGIYLAILHESPQLAIFASLLWLAGALAFALARASSRLQPRMQR